MNHIIIIIGIILILLYIYTDKSNNKENFYMEYGRKKHFKPYIHSYWLNWPYYWWNWWSPYGYVPCVDTANGKLECL